METATIETEREEALPIEMLLALFEARGWQAEQLGIDEMTGEIQGSWAKYQLRVIWREEDNVLQLLCLPDIRVSDEKKQAMFEALALINEQLWVGHFDIWTNNSVLLYRHGMLLSDDGLLSISQAQMLVEAALEECDRFYPVFQFILWGDKSPTEALASALIDTVGEA